MTVTSNDAARAPQSWSLVQRVQEGDAEAFGIIFDQNCDRIYRFLLFRVGDRDTAEDLTSDTFLRAMKSIDKFVWQERDVVNWLYTIARRLVLDHVKSANHRCTTPVPDFPSAIAIHGQGNRTIETQPARAVVEHMTNLELLSAVKDLIPEQKECIILRFLEERTVEETGQIMGKKPNAIKSLQYRALKSLRRAVPHLAPNLEDA